LFLKFGGVVVPPAPVGLTPISPTPLIPLVFLPREFNLT